MTFVPVENEKDIRQSSYMTVKTSVSFDEAKKVRRQYGKHAYILPYVPKLEIEQPKRVVVGKNKKSYTFRIVYRSPERTLTSEEVNKIQEEIREATQKDLSAMLR